MVFITMLIAVRHIVLLNETKSCEKENKTVCSVGDKRMCQVLHLCTHTTAQTLKRKNFSEQQRHTTIPIAVARDHCQVAVSSQKKTLD